MTVNQNVLTFKQRYYIKKKASRGIISNMHKLLTEIAPMSKKQIKNPTTNTKLIDNILNAFNTNLAKSLSDKVPVNSLNSTVPYLYYNDTHESYVNIKPIRTINKNHNNYKNFLFTKHADSEFNYLKHKGYKYVHVYNRLIRYNYIEAVESVRANSKNIYTQLNAPTKRDLLKMIRCIIWDASLFNPRILTKLLLTAP